jgi:signal peptidase II
MKSNRLLRTLVIVIILAVNIGCDQVSKTLVRNTIEMDQKFHYLDNHVMLTRVENTGAFLSLGNSLSVQIKFILLIAVPMAALLIAIYYLFSKTTISRISLVAISCIVGGGFGNIYDRYLYGSVTDFMHVDLILFRTGIFNMADVSIMVGALILVASTIIRTGDSFMKLDSDSNQS